MSIARLFKQHDEKFFENLKKVDRGFVSDTGKSSKCLEWQGAVFSNGYGRLGMPATTKHEKIHRTHRYSYFLANGKIAKALSVLHKCDNRLCCNPKHLYQGDHRENMRDMISRGRQAVGSRSGKAVFNEDDVAFIRFFYSIGFTYTSIAEMVGSTKSTISNIISRLQWDHVEDILPSEKRVIKYIKSRKKKSKPLIAPLIRNSGSTSAVKQCRLGSIREMVNVFGQERFASMTGTTRKKIRCLLENDDNSIVEVNPTTGDMKVFTESKGDLSPQRIVELISQH